MNPNQKKKNEYFDAMARIGRVLSSAFCDELIKKNKDEIKTECKKCSVAGEKILKKLEYLFNKSTDKDQQVFLAFEIKQIQKQIEILNSDYTPGLFISIVAAMSYIGATSQALSIVYMVELSEDFD